MFPRWESHVPKVGMLSLSAGGYEFKKLGYYLALSFLCRIFAFQ